VRGEDPLLFGRRQTRVERQHLGVLQIAQSICGVANLALAGQEDEHITGRLFLELGDGVHDGLGLVSHLRADDFVVGVVGVVPL
jgi:hypothetical protein